MSGLQFIKEYFFKDSQSLLEDKNHDFYKIIGTNQGDVLRKVSKRTDYTEQQTLEPGYVTELKKMPLEISTPITDLIGIDNLVLTSGGGKTSLFLPNKNAPDQDVFRLTYDIDQGLPDLSFNVKSEPLNITKILGTDGNFEESVRGFFDTVLDAEPNFFHRLYVPFPPGSTILISTPTGEYIGKNLNADKVGKVQESTVIIDGTPVKFFKIEVNTVFVNGKLVKFVYPQLLQYEVTAFDGDSSDTKSDDGLGSVVPYTPPKATPHYYDSLGINLITDNQSIIISNGKPDENLDIIAFSFQIGTESHQIPLTRGAKHYSVIYTTRKVQATSVDHITIMSNGVAVSNFDAPAGAQVSLNHATGTNFPVTIAQATSTGFRKQKAGNLILTSFNGRLVGIDIQ